MLLIGAGMLLAAVSGATGCISRTGVAPPDRSDGSPPGTATPTATLPARVGPPDQPLPGETARFFFWRPGQNNVSVGPYEVSERVLMVHGACGTRTGSLVWKVFDNTDEGTSAGPPILDEGQLRCDGTTQLAAADIGDVTQIGILAVSDTPEGADDGEWAWLVAALE